MRNAATPGQGQGVVGRGGAWASAGAARRGAKGARLREPGRIARPRGSRRAAAMGGGRRSGAPAREAREAGRRYARAPSRAAPRPALAAFSQSFYSLSAGKRKMRTVRGLVCSARGPGGSMTRSDLEGHRPARPRGASGRTAHEPWREWPSSNKLPGTAFVYCWGHQRQTELGA